MRGLTRRPTGWLRSPAPRPAHRSLAHPYRFEESQKISATAFRIGIHLGETDQGVGRYAGELVPRPRARCESTRGTTGTVPVQAGPQGPQLLSERRGGRCVTRQGRSAAENVRSALTRRPSRSYSPLANGGDASRPAVGDGFLPLPGWKNQPGATWREGCDGGTPIAPENRRFSIGRSRHHGRRNVRPSCLAAVAIGPARPAVSGGDGAAAMM